MTPLSSSWLGGAQLPFIGTDVHVAGSANVIILTCVSHVRYVSGSMYVWMLSNTDFRGCSPQSSVCATVIKPMEVQREQE